MTQATLHETLATCSFLMLTRDQEANTVRAIRTFAEQGWPAPLLLLDNGSGSDTQAVLEAFPERVGGDLAVFGDGSNLGTTAGRNYLARQATTDWVVFVDNDVLFTDELPKFVEELSTTTADIVLPIVLSAEGDVWSAGGVYRPLLSWSSNGYFKAAVDQARRDLDRAADWGPSCCLAFRRTVFEEVRGYDLGYGLYGSEDIDLCLRARKGGAVSTRSATAPIVHLDKGTGTDWASKLGVLRRTDRRLRQQHGVRAMRLPASLYWELRRSPRFEPLRRLVGQPSAGPHAGGETAPARAGRGTVVAWGALPPPVHGSSIVNVQVRDLMARSRNVYWVNPATAGMTELGQVSPRKATLTLGRMAAFAWYSASNRHSTAYLSVATSGPALYRDLLVWAMAAISSDRVVVHVHSGDLAGLSPIGPLAPLKRQLNRRSEFWTLGSAFVKPLEEAGAATVRVTPNGVVCESAHHVVLRPARPEESPVRVVFLGHHFLTKGIDVIAELALLLAGEPFTWAMAGSIVEPEAEDALRPLGQLGDSYRRIEHLDGDVRCLLLQESDVLLMPSRYQHEASPLVLLEAMEHGVVPLVSSRGCMPEVVGEAGSVCDTVEELAHELRSLVKDPGELERRAGLCRQRWQDAYSKEAFDDRIESLLEESPAGMNRAASR